MRTATAKDLRQPRHLGASVHEDTTEGLPPRPPTRPRDSHVDREHAHAVAIIWALAGAAPWLALLVESRTG